MHSMTDLYVLIADEMKECINFEAFDLSNIDDLGDEMLAVEDGLREDILFNNDFNWYEEDGRKKLCESVMHYEGATFAKLSEALKDEDKTADLIFELIFDEVCNDLLADYTAKLKGEN